MLNCTSVDPVQNLSINGPLGLQPPILVICRFRHRCTQLRPFPAYSKMSPIKLLRSTAETHPASLPRVSRLHLHVSAMTWYNLKYSRRAQHMPERITINMDISCSSHVPGIFHKIVQGRSSLYTPVSATMHEDASYREMT